MDMSFGKYVGKPVAWVLLEDVQYFFWMVDSGLSEKIEIKFALKLINIFDELPFKNVKCHGKCKGENTVTRLSLYNSQYNYQNWFCDKCDPYNNGSFSGKLTYISKFSHVLYEKDSQTIIKAMASAKGVPQRKTSKALKEFFGY